MSDAPGKSKFVGARFPRLEDSRLVAGLGRFVDDLEPPGTLHMRLVRAQLAHAHITNIDVGFLASEFPEAMVFTAGDVPDLAVRAKQGLPGTQHSSQPVLATDVVRFVGEPVAAVLCDDPYVAEDAAELVHVEYDPLPVLNSTEAALAPDAPLMFKDWKDNRYAEREMAGGDIDFARANAAHVVRRTYRTNRQAGVPMECRGILAEVDHTGRNLTVSASTQIPHLLRTYLAEELDWPENRIRVTAPEVGGGFGVKGHVFVEEVLVAWLAIHTQRPVKWIEDRREHLIASIHARDHVHTLTAYLTTEGMFLGLEADVTVDTGAYAVWPWTAGGEAGMASKVMVGPYDIPAYYGKMHSVATNKCPLGTYRGVARPSAAFSMERLMDDIAEELDLDPIEFRLQNIVRDYPYKNALGFEYDSGSSAEALELARELLVADREEARATRDSSVSVGVGVACFIEQTAHGTCDFTRRSVPIETGYESARVEMEPDGRVVVSTGLQSHGQGHETVFAQIAADQLGITPDDIVVRHGDTLTGPYSVGTWGSRGATLGGGAVHGAAQIIREKLLLIAAHNLECRSEDLNLADGRAYRSDDPTQFLTVATLARWANRNVDKLPTGIQPGLSATDTLDGPPDGTYSNAVHAAVVEIDKNTGKLKLRRFVVIEDCGTLINPMIVEGQARGGVTQGIGSALFEQIIYDEEGQPLTTNFADYLMPLATEIPDIEIHHFETPSPLTRLGIKGVGEGGAIGPMAAVANAVKNALGVPVDEIPFTLERVLNLANQTKS